MTPVTDPAILAQLEGSPVTDPAILARLEGGKKKSSMWDVVKNAAAEGVAGIPDMFLNAPNRLRNLSEIPRGIGYALAGRPELAPEMQPDPDLARRGGIAAGAIDPNVVPTGEQKIVDALVRGAVGGGLTGGLGVGKALVGAGMGGASSLAATGAQEATDSPLAGVLAGLAVPGGAAAYSAAARSGAPGLMKSALKPTLDDHKSGAAAKAAQTLLDEGVNATKGGVAKLSDRIESTNEKITKAILESKATVNKNEVAGRLHEPMERVSKQVNPKADVAAVEKAWTEFSEHPMIPGQQIPVQLAHEMKQGTYRQLREKYGEEGSAAVEAQKTLARGLKEEVAKAVPEVVPLNARESALLNAREIAERRSLMDANKNPLGLSPLAGGMKQAGMMLADRSALVKSLLARALNSSGKATKGVGANAAIPLSFQEDAMRRQQIIEALMGQQ